MSKGSLIRKICLAESSSLKLLLLDKPRRKWVSDLFQSREKYGEYHANFKKLAANPDVFVENFNVKPKTFYYILKKIGRHIRKTSNFRKCIGPKERLAVTLNFLASGTSFRSLSFKYRMSIGAIRDIVYSTSHAICEQLGPKHMPTPTVKNLRKVARNYYKKFKFPNCVGTIDKELLWMKYIQAPYKYHYKKKVLLPLTGIADANYKFIAIDVGQIPNDTLPEGLLNDIENNKIQFPPPKKAPHLDINLGHVIVGTKYFPLRRYLLKPFSQRELPPDAEEFNETLENVHKVVETTFNLLTSKWRYLNTVMKIGIEKITTVLKCICVLHNVTIDKEGIDDSVLYEAINSTRRKVEDYSLRRYNRSNTMAYTMRDNYKNYFMGRIRQELLNGHDDDENPAKRRKLSSPSISSSSSSSSESDSDISDSDESDFLSSSSDSESDVESSSTGGSDNSLESDADEEDEEVDIEDEIDIKDEPLDDDFDDTEVKPELSALETFEIHELDEDSLDEDVKPDPDILQEIKEENEELNTSSKSQEEVRIKEEPDLNSSGTQESATVRLFAD